MKPHILIRFLALFCFLSGCSISPDPTSGPDSQKMDTRIPPATIASESQIRETPTHTRSTQPAAIVTRTHTASPTAARSPTAEATHTSTPQPPLVSHTWKLDNILLQIEVGNGDGGYWEIDPPRLVFYSNGLLIRPTYEDGRNKMMGRYLSRAEMCALFNTLDQVGFLDYDHSVYMDPMDGLGSTWITVNIWKNQQIYGQVLDKWVYEGGDWWYKVCDIKGCLPPPVILPALANTYKLLEQYNPGGLVELPVETMVVWALPIESEVQPKPWTMKEIALEKIEQKATEGNGFAFYVEDPTLVRALQDKFVPGYYVEGDVSRRVTVRPLWPGETHFGMYFPGLPTASPLVTDGTTLTCHPEDGLLPVPD